MKNDNEIGMVGLGVMGRNVLLNMADHGHAVAGYDQDESKVDALRTEAADRDIQGAGSVAAFVGLLRKPRVVMILVPAGAAVESVIRDLLPHLEPGDLLIDAGNSHFTDTDRRQRTLEAKGLHFFGMGVSGGSHGARFGPSMMPGGPREAYEYMRPILEAIAAHVHGEPCVAYLGPRSAGHYVKMVHNGIEYGIMQLIAETYDLMHKGLGMTADELHGVFHRWKEGELNGYLMEITADIFLEEDEQTGKRLIDVILDAARQKGTGMWTSQDAMALQVPTPTIDTAVALRNLSALDDERAAVSRQFAGPDSVFDGDRDAFVEQLRGALYAATILVYAQGMALLRGASQVYDYELDLETVARIWRGGCIIRSALLEPIREAYRARPDLPHLLLDAPLAGEVAARQGDLRSVVQTAAALGIPAPGLMGSLAYFDAYRSDRLPANLIQAQRDYFGAHTYERIDARGVFHTQWTHE